MAQTDVWELTMHGELYGQVCDNVFFYQGVSGTDPELDDIAQAFYEQVWSLIQIPLIADYTLNTIEVRHLFSGASPFILPVAEQGTGFTGQGVSPFNAFGFSLGVASNATRPGSKRIPGVAEASIDDGIVTDGGTITALQDMADQFSTALVDVTLGIVTWGLPIIVKRILDGGTYRLPVNIGEFVGNLIVDVAASLVMTSQNSRKVGRGA